MLRPLSHPQRGRPSSKSLFFFVNAHCSIIFKSDFLYPVPIILVLLSALYILVGNFNTSPTVADVFFYFSVCLPLFFTVRMRYATRNQLESVLKWSDLHSLIKSKSRHSTFKFVIFFVFNLIDYLVCNERKFPIRESVDGIVPSLPG